MRLLLAARLSSKPKKGKDQHRLDHGLGIETQDARGREWAERAGHEIVGVAADTQTGIAPPWDRKNLRPWVACGCGWCRDQDEKRNVPEKKRIYDGSKIALYDGILAYKMDRLSRGDQEDFTRIEMWATHHGKQLVIVDGPRYPAREDSDFWSWTAQKQAARKEWESSRERNARIRERLIRDEALTTKPPFGYSIDGELYKKTLIPTDEGRRYVPEVFDQIIAGGSIGDLARWLTEETGRAWYRKNVRDMIYCTTYLGEQRNRSGRTILPCEPILVTADGKPDWPRFRLAQKVLSAHPRRGPRPEGRAMLSGVLYCGNPDCTVGGRDKAGNVVPARMYRAVNRVRDRTYAYYQCHGRGPEQKTRKGCGNRVRIDWCDASVSRIVAETFNIPVTAFLLIPGIDHQAERDQVREDMAQLPLLDLPDEEFDFRMAELRRERDRLAALKDESPRHEVTETGEGTYSELWAGLDIGERAWFLERHKFRVAAVKGTVRVERGVGIGGQVAVWSEELSMVISNASVMALEASA